MTANRKFPNVRDTDMVAYLDRHFATTDWLTQDVWFQVRKRLKAEEAFRKNDQEIERSEQQCINS